MNIGVLVTIVLVILVVVGIAMRALGQDGRVLEAAMVVSVLWLLLRSLPLHW